MYDRLRYGMSQVLVFSHLQVIALESWEVLNYTLRSLISLGLYSRDSWFQIWSELQESCSFVLAFDLRFTVPFGMIAGRVLVVVRELILPLNLGLDSCGPLLLSLKSKVLSFCIHLCSDGTCLAQHDSSEIIRRVDSCSVELLERNDRLNLLGAGGIRNHRSYYLVRRVFLLRVRR